MRTWLGLSAAGEHHELPAVKTPNILRPHDASVRNAQLSEAMGDFDIVDHAAAHETDLAPHGSATSITCWMRWTELEKQETTNFLGRRAKEFFQAHDDCSFGKRETGRSTLVLSLKRASTPSCP